MKGIWILLLLILAATLPAIIVFFWFRSKRSAVTLPWFMAAITAGIVSVLAAALIQRFFPLGGVGIWKLFFGVFVRAALVEELSRVVTLIPFLFFIKEVQSQNTDISFGAALGLASGLGFAIIENAFFGQKTSDLGIILLRSFTAAPLHAACGIRAGMAVFIFTENKGKAFFYFISAVLIHGAYNLMIVSPAIPSLLALPTALAAFFASLTYIHKSFKQEKGDEQW